MDSLQTLNIKRLTDGDTNSYSGTASSIDSTGSTSYTGGAAAGWVIKIPNGPIIYHTGDTNIFADIRLVNQVYKPTHTVLPIGELCTLKAFDAAYVCKNFLTNCQTVIPINFKVCESQNQVLETKHMNEDQLLESDSEGYTESVQPVCIYSTLQNQFNRLGGNKINTKIVYSEYEVLGQWFDLHI